MQAKVKTIKDFTAGNTIYPVTKADAVYMSDDMTTLETKVGTAALNTTAQDLSGAVNELNGNFASGTWTPSFPRNTVTIDMAKWYRVGNILVASCRFTVTASTGANSIIEGTSLPIPSGYNRTNTIMNGSWHGNNDTGGEVGQNGFGGSSVWFSKGGAHVVLPATTYGLTLVGVLTKN